MREEMFRVPVLVANDTTLAAVGERAYGAAQGFDNLVYISVGTGIGGGIVLCPAARRRRGHVERERAALLSLESGSPADRLEQVLRVHGFHPPSELRASCQAGIEPERLGAVMQELEAAGRWKPIPGQTEPLEPRPLHLVRRSGVEFQTASWGG